MNPTQKEGEKNEAVFFPFSNFKSTERTYQMDVQLTVQSRCRIQVQCSRIVSAVYIHPALSNDTLVIKNNKINKVKIICIKTPLGF